MGQRMDAAAPESWRLIMADGSDAELPSGQDGPLNMAVDQALLEAVAGGAAPVVRLYRWSPATISFGRNQPARDLYDRERAAARGIRFVRRPTGGQAVLHDDELTYAVVAPVALLGKPRAAYRRINEALASGLLELGVQAGISGAGVAGLTGGAAPGAGGAAAAEGGTRKSWTEACFRRPERGEVVARGRKLVGSAQRTESRTLLQHGSILLGGSQLPAEDLLRSGASLLAADSSASAGAGTVDRGAGEPGWTTLARELGRPPEMAGLVEALVTGFEVTLGITLARSRLTSRERTGLEDSRDRFGSPEWTWRR